LAILKVNALPSGSDAVGLKEYGRPVAAAVTGVPPITGGRLAAAVAEMGKLASDADRARSDTVMAMFDHVPAAVGVPLRRPVVVLNVAHAGLLAILKVNALPSGSDAIGVKLYACPTVADLAGVPLMTGGRLETAAAVMEKLASVAVKAPSDTLIAMLDAVPATVGVPLSLPVVVLNVAHAGLLVILKVSALPSGSDAVGVKLYA
jgi:energy-converting hydrogenase Eha subunit E